ncbi:hypothetical protein [Aestuariibaculum marinum]|uniref:Uncharacterized protein n=1 Tax=Aestuariibaculum marinum TaxID=2683592 RepID=A0A8J6U2T1_9FLAO|nr:hypothetical protein [Aestuariibaculum marinum]MBD0822642.1 hypothetical protein [Aestuariibaculum marinum]
MNTTNFKVKLTRKEVPTVEYDSKEGDEIKVEEKSVSLNLKGDTCKEILNARFDAIEVVIGKKKPVIKQTRTFTRLLDNGVTKIKINFI